MRITDYLAIWGAFIGTVVAAWNIYKDFIKRDRVKVTAGFQIQFPPKLEVFVFQVTNLSSHKIKVTHCGGYPAREFHRRWLRPYLKWLRPGSSKAFLFSFNTLDGDHLPFSIEPFDKHIFIYGINHAAFPVVEELWIATADGHEWFCPRRDIEKIHSDETYKAIQAKRASSSKIPT
jgi:hypothetical protein